MKIIGRADKASFPELFIDKIDVKIDTGAYTSSIHCHEIKKVNNLVEFKILDPSHPEYQDRVFKAKNFTEKDIKSSNGSSEVRYVIKTVISLFEEEFPIELSLTNRENMKFPVLLGRKFLNKRFIVDSARQNLSAAKK